MPMRSSKAQLTDAALSFGLFVDVAKPNTIESK
jgi:hypothetical protein